MPAQNHRLISRPIRSLIPHTRPYLCLSTYCLQEEVHAEEAIGPSLPGLLGNTCFVQHVGSLPRSPSPF